MGSVIVITSGKGGTGKTSLTGGVGASLALLGKQVLCLDGDVGLRNLDITLGMTDAALMDFSDVMAGRCDLSRAAVPHPTVSGLHLLTAPLTLPGDFPGEAGFQALLQQAREAYDYVLIDCSPSLGMITINALVAADSVIIPVQSHYLPTKGMSQLMQTINRVRRGLNPSLRVDGALLTMTDSRTLLSREVSAALRNSYAGKLRIFQTEIPFAIRTAEAAAAGKSVFAHDPDGKTAAAYTALTKEVEAYGRQRARADRDQLDR